MKNMMRCFAIFMMFQNVFADLHKTGTGWIYNDCGECMARTDILNALVNAKQTLYQMTKKPRKVILEELLGSNDIPTNIPLINIMPMLCERILIKQKIGLDGAAAWSKLLWKGPCSIFGTIDEKINIIKNKNRILSNIYTSS